MNLLEPTTVDAQFDAWSSRQKVIRKQKTKNRQKKLVACTDAGARTYRTHIVHTLYAHQ